MGEKVMTCTNTACAIFVVCQNKDRPCPGNAVPDWLYDAVSDVAVNLNMSVSDFVYLCWCIGASTAISENMVPEIVGKDFSAILSRFRMSMEGYTFQIKSTVERMAKSESIINAIPASEHH